MYGRVKEIIKQFLPPVVFNLCRTILKKFRKRPEPYVGMYKTFQECRMKNAAASDFNNPNYAKWSRDKTDRYLKMPVHLHSIRIKDLKFLIYVQSLLDQLGNIRIFDFGGGVGWHYVKLFRYIKEFSKIHYTICDLPEVVHISKEYFHNKNLRNIEFISKLPKGGTKFDMCILSSVLHYIEDYRGLLKSISSYNPKFFFISRLPARDLNEFVTLQTISEARFPCYVFNWTDIKRILSDLNYFVYDEWDEGESFFLKVQGNEIKLPTYKGAVFACNRTSFRKIG